MDIFLFSGTHWDREWYQSFQGFRVRLVKMIDELIDELETNSDFGVFHFDGQTIVLEDYLEIMPQNENRLKALIEKGKIEIGPWYCMPDELILSGESLIKNLQKGFKIARKFGVQPLKYGYICDIFGHIAQMPQIFSEFGINNALLGRGTNEHTTDAHFTWQSPDGSEVTTFKLADSNGYGSFTAAITNNNYTGEQLDVELKKFTDSELMRSKVPVVLLMDALDHANVNKRTAEYINRLKQLYPEASVHHTSVMEMCELIKQYKHMLPIKTGELIEPAKRRESYIHLITNTLSSRYPIKKYNDILQTKLESIVQPMYAYGLSALADSYVELANTYMLKNQPHDSICGCSIDAVHRDMMYRYNQADMICGEIINDFVHSITDDVKSENIVIKVYNPLPYDYCSTVTVNIEFPTDYCRKYAEPFGYEEINSFKIYDDNGNELPYGTENIKCGQTIRVYNQNVKKTDVYTVSFNAKLIASGITEFTVKPFNESSRYLSRPEQSETYAENKFIRLDINLNGTINILDKKTNKTYKNILTAADDGEIGDGWYHANPACDKVVTNTVCTIEKIVSNTVKTVFKVTQHMKLPEQTVNNRRSETKVDFNIVHLISLSESDRFVSVTTQINNTAKDHRLRIKIPTGINGQKYYVNQPFCFVERKTDVDISTQSWSECEVPEKQMGGIVYKRDEMAGIAFISKFGLHECSVNSVGDIYITMLRAFNKTVMTNGEDGGQLLEKLEYQYMLVPFDNSTSQSQLQKMQNVYQTGIISMCAGGEARKNNSYMKIDGDNILFSTANKINGGMEVRIYNVSQNEENAIIETYKKFKSANLVNLDGQIKENVKSYGRKFEFSVKSNKFVTLRLEDAIDD